MEIAILITLFLLIVALDLASLRWGKNFRYYLDNLEEYRECDQPTYKYY